MTDPYSDEEIGGLGSGPRYPTGLGSELDTLRAYVQDTMPEFGAWCIRRLLAADADTTEETTR